MMFRHILALVLMLSTLVSFSASVGAEEQDSVHAQELLARAIAYYKEKGDIALATFSRQSEFITKDLYVYVLSADGLMLASGGSSSVLIDRSVADMKDASGKSFFREMLDTAKAQGRGQIEYRWVNRQNGKIERKIAYFERVGEKILAVGYYLPHGTSAQAEALVERAALAVQADPAKAFRDFNDLNGSYIEDDLYVFVIGLDDARFRAHGALPRLVGTSADLLRDAQGKEFIPTMRDKLRKTDKAQIIYPWKNTVTGKVLIKHTYLRKVGSYLIGVGYYEN
ncbi:cache domain-containing protein [Ferribacterium limneticum]|uniref:cache domain-containing protein n=1 Tax=Ferribacterium limneticum TaxID=76259 RepID=UPI001CF8C925|nr:cache domain-containing protein [Ferribacterium limneticum]UCV23628.1 cache domain-containing protein [Ferribacterium limneticum]